MITPIQQVPESSTTLIQHLLIQTFTIMMCIGAMIFIFILIRVNTMNTLIQQNLNQNPFIDILFAQSLK